MATYPCSLLVMNGSAPETKASAAEKAHALEEQKMIDFRCIQDGTVEVIRLVFSSAKITTAWKLLSPAARYQSFLVCLTPPRRPASTEPMSNALAGTQQNTWFFSLFGVNVVRDRHYKSADMRGS